MPKTAKRPTARTKQPVSGQSWRNDEAASWQAVRGLWTDHRVDAVKYQRGIRKDRRQP